LRSIRLLYDVSVLGLGQRDARARTGVFRVVENVAGHLAAQSSIRLRFSSMIAPGASLRYTGRQQAFTTVPMTSSRARLGLDLSVDWLSDEIGRTRNSAARGALRVCRALAARALGRMNPMTRAELREIDIVHSPYFPLAQETRSVPGLLRFLTVYDLIPILHPEFFGNTEDHVVRRAVAALTPDDWVLCISESTRRDLLNHRPDLTPEHVRVTHLGAAPHFHPDRQDERWPKLRKRYNLPEGPYALTLSTLEPRKNIALALRSYARLCLEGQVGDLRLVLVGTAGWQMESIHQELDRLGQLRDRVIVTGYVPDEDLAPIYTRALMFIYPSLYEGFGLPPLEAMQCGVPVVTSNVTSLPEVVGDAGILISPTDGDALCQAILTLFRDDALRAEMSARALTRARQFSWRRCGEQTISAYLDALRE
jgi:glycosyltransferase involved in cell wall biosynthesis